MAHFAEIDENNIVTRIIVIADKFESTGESWCTNFTGGGTWKQTSYNTYGNVHALGGTPFRKNYAIVGSTYDATRDAFILPKTSASWVLDETTCLWKAPVDIPGPTDEYYWDEDTLSWRQEE